MSNAYGYGITWKFLFPTYEDFVAFMSDTLIEPSVDIWNLLNRKFKNRVFKKGNADQIKGDIESKWLDTTYTFNQIVDTRKNTNLENIDDELETREIFINDRTTGDVNGEGTKKNFLDNTGRQTNKLSKLDIQNAINKQPKIYEQIIDSWRLIFLPGIPKVSTDSL